MPFEISVDRYVLNCALHELPAIYDVYKKNAVLTEEVNLAGEGSLCFLSVGDGSPAGWPFLVLALRYDPPHRSGFKPGVLVVPETGTLFVGAGTTLMAYDLNGPRRLWEDAADVGFWCWRRHGELVVMSAELEMAVWDIWGRKLWATFVEPPWHYTVEGGDIHLDVMGTRSRFPIRSGPGRL